MIKVKTPTGAPRDGGHWTTIPNIVFFAGLSAGAISLYCAILKSANETEAGQTCYRSCKTLAFNSGQSVGGASENRRLLKNLGYIVVRKLDKNDAKDKKWIRRGVLGYKIRPVPLLKLSLAFFLLKNERPALTDGLVFGLDRNGTRLVEYEILSKTQVRKVRDVMQLI